VESPFSEVSEFAPPPPLWVFFEAELDFARVHSIPNMPTLLLKSKPCRMAGSCAMSLWAWDGARRRATVFATTPCSSQAWHQLAGFTVAAFCCSTSGPYPSNPNNNKVSYA